VFEIGELVGFVMPAEELGWGCGENDKRKCRRREGGGTTEQRETARLWRWERFLESIGSQWAVVVIVLPLFMRNRMSMEIPNSIYRVELPS
jgi:hypothetical protein